MAVEQDGGSSERIVATSQLASLPDQGGSLATVQGGKPPSKGGSLATLQGGEPPSQEVSPADREHHLLHLWQTVSQLEGARSEAALQRRR